MDIISIVNMMSPGTISKFALNQTDFPSGEYSTPFMGGYVQLFPGATLPDPSFVTEYESTYNAAIAKRDSYNVIKYQIDVLESSITDRRLREAILGIDNGWLSGINNEILNLRSQLT